VTSTRRPFGPRGTFGGSCVSVKILRIRQRVGPMKKFLEGCPFGCFFVCDVGAEIWGVDGGGDVLVWAMDCLWGVFGVFDRLEGAQNLLKE
jgi:hypothetical protein